MSESDDDLLRAERQYIETRLTELRADLKSHERELGFPINAETVEELMDGVSEALVGLGHAPLAKAYRAAWERWKRAIKAHEAVIAAEQIDALEASKAASDEAQEDFERLEADVNVVLQRAIDKGGQQ